MARGNPKGLKKSAQKKREESFRKFEEGIQKLIREQKAINFNTVAEASGVSKAWLYKESSVKARIETLRAQQSEKKKLPPQHRVSDESKNAIIKTLRIKVKEKEREIAELKKERETVYGRLLQLERVERENQRLRERIQQLENGSGSFSKIENPNKVVSIQTGEISETIQIKLKILGIGLSTTLRKKILSKPENIILAAIAALEQAIESGQAIRNPAGWLSKGIDDEWEKNKSLQKEKLSHPEGFESWYAEMVEKKLVINLPVSHLNCDGYGKPKVKIPAPGQVPPYREMPWEQAREELQG